MIIQQGYSPSRWSQTPQCPCTNPWVCPNPSPFADTILPTCDIQRAGGMLWKSPGCCRSTGMLAASRQGGQGSAMLREHFACHHPLPRSPWVHPNPHLECWALGLVSVPLHDPAWPCLEWRWQLSAHKPHRALCCSPPPFHSRGSHPPSEDAQGASACRMGDRAALTPGWHFPCC